MLIGRICINRGNRNFLKGPSSEKWARFPIDFHTVVLLFATGGAAPDCRFNTLAGCHHFSDLKSMLATHRRWQMHHECTEESSFSCFKQSKLIMFSL